MPGGRVAECGGPSRTAKSADAAGAGESPVSGSRALEASVLVLNRAYVAVRVVNVRRAFCLLCRGLAEVVHCEDGHFAQFTFDAWLDWCQNRQEPRGVNDDWIRAVTFEIQAPRIIRLLRYDRIPRQQMHLSRRNVLARDGHVCQYCGRHFPTSQLSIDHVLPRSRGGQTTWDNVVCACLACNVRKGGRTPQEARMKLIRQPAKPARNPVLVIKLNNPKYASWRAWLEGVSWELGVRDA